MQKGEHSKKSKGNIPVISRLTEALGEQVPEEGVRRGPSVKR